jgi:hypothetical protein
MVIDKLCPLKQNKKTIPDGSIVEFGKCDGKNCAWWQKDYGGSCSVEGLIHSIKQLGMDLRR